MTILIANIGTSDIAVTVQNHYIPIGFNRNEINAQFKEEPTADEKEIWDDQGFRNSLIISELCHPLNVKVTTNDGRETFSFLDLTSQLKAAYITDPDTWHQRISPGRIAGVLKIATSPAFNVTEAFIFVTQQDPPHFSDTIHLFEILELWCKREFPSIKLKKEEINFKPTDQDALFDCYYHFFNSRNQTEMILVSNKGGSPQMREALKIQAMASGISQQLFIEPDLCKTKVVRGELSDCHLISYWQYMRTQKYQTVDLLLKMRWDFDGAVKILEEWKKYLKFVTRHKASPQGILTPSITTVNQVIKALSVAVDCFNLDIPSAKKTLRDNPKIGNFTEWDRQISQSAESQVLNLYTRCQIYWELKQAANFLASMSSFYEEVLYRVLQIYSGEEFFDSNRPGKWYLSKARIVQKMGQEKWEEFLALGDPYNEGLRRYNFQENPFFQLTNRPNKRNFVGVLVNYRQRQVEDWARVRDALKSLDYWARKRNEMIHGASGISIGRMHELYKEECQPCDDACKPDKILEVMAGICESPLSILKEDYRNRYVKEGSDYYIYSQVQQWVIGQLMEDAKR